jgi:hypothetical protein
MKLKKKDLPALKAEIKRLAAEGRAYNSRIQDAHGPERHRLRGEKGSIGWDARMLLLAYAFLRGVPYRVLEPKCLEDTSSYLRKPLIHWTGLAVKEWDPQKHEEIEEQVEAWFNVELPTVEEVAA